MKILKKIKEWIKNHNIPWESIIILGFTFGAMLTIIIVAGYIILKGN